MARGKTPQPTLRSASLSAAQALEAIPKLERRLDELQKISYAELAGPSGEGILEELKQKLNATLRDVYGSDTLDYQEISVETYGPKFLMWYDGMDTSIAGNIDTVRGKIERSASRLRAQIEVLKEQSGASNSDPVLRSVRAFEGLDLHPEIARASSKLFLDGHYANAVEASVKALNGLVRLRSGLENDGSALMEKAFSPNNPILKFNDLSSQSDKDEQRGYMMMFSGAVAGLRNPRAHGFVSDKPERALEFVAFVSLLAKLLDEASA